MRAIVDENNQIVTWANNLNPSISIECPEDYSPDKYNYSNGVFTLKPPSINFEKRQENIKLMNDYMYSFVISGDLTEANFNKFLSETATNSFGYLNGSSRLITWIATTNENGYNASTSGFKTDPDYRGEQIDGEYPRANYILEILNNL